MAKTILVMTVTTFFLIIIVTTDSKLYLVRQPLFEFLIPTKDGPYLKKTVVLIPEQSLRQPILNVCERRSMIF